MKKTILFITMFWYASWACATKPLQLYDKEMYEATMQYKIQLHYPQIHAPLTPAENKFNTIIRKQVFNEARKFKKIITRANITHLPLSIQGSGSYLTISYTMAVLNSNAIVSIRFKADSFFPGSAHPNHTYYAINYDLIQNKTLSLSDLFIVNSNYLDYIAKVSSHKLQAELNALKDNHVAIFNEGLRPVPQNYEVWNLTAKGLKFTFNESHVTAYVYGPQEVTISYDMLMQFFSNISITTCLRTHSCTFTQ